MIKWLIFGSSAVKILKMVPTAEIFEFFKNFFDFDPSRVGRGNLGRGQFGPKLRFCTRTLVWLFHLCCKLIIMKK